MIQTIIGEPAVIETLTGTRILIGEDPVKEGQAVARTKIGENPMTERHTDRIFTSPKYLTQSTPLKHNISSQPSHRGFNNLAPPKGKPPQFDYIGYEHV